MDTEYQALSEVKDESKNAPESIHKDKIKANHQMEDEVTNKKKIVNKKQHIKQWFFEHKTFIAHIIEFSLILGGIIYATKQISEIKGSNHELSKTSLELLRQINDISINSTKINTYFQTLSFLANQDNLNQVISISNDPNIKNISLLIQSVMDFKNEMNQKQDNIQSFKMGVISWSTTLYSTETITYDLNLLMKVNNKNGLFQINYYDSSGCAFGIKEHDSGLSLYTAYSTAPFSQYIQRTFNFISKFITLDFVTDHCNDNNRFSIQLLIII